ncbi:hypothetical protein B0G76_4484 [Paraburkholderia sp. BL23I1N1]|uniref:hypothetical protein n=1 Tax=Paraburkholderia sp. BL23I1N1 TaxID=1938802 RepID=UPI000E760EFB|nr:hypothetical protein [Paraburkholderia sp. BL23I1N1]RKE38187.1 hypothetical protein B0G76_4484 [Paraburkholderia sp. BL23I1N1]
MSDDLRVRTGDEAGHRGPPWMSGQASAQVVRSGFNAVRTRTLCKVGALAAMIVAAGVVIAMGEGVINTDTPTVQRAIEPQQDCSAKYTALLDLAELARRDGKSSEVVVRGLSDRGGALSECLPVGRSAGAK